LRPVLGDEVMAFRQHIFTFCGVVAGVVAWAATTLGQSNAAPEYIVKAALISKFAEFVEWPQQAFSDDQDPVIFATVGDDPFRGGLDDLLSGKTIGARPILVKHFPDAEHIERCHVLFVCGSEQGRLPLIFQKLSKFYVLTISDVDDFCPKGGIIQFILEDEKVHFEINTDAADQSNIKISSRLLKLAKIYKQ
jgi:YfiR/HmsC-like